MKKETKKISTELAIGFILFFSIIVAIAIYRAGSFSAALNYIPQKINKRNSVKKEPERILFATNGEREIYKVKKDDGKWAVIIDGQEGDAYDEVFDGTFSDDGSQFAYGATNEGESFVVLDNRANNRRYSSIGQIIFAKDGTLIYKVISEDGEFLVIGDQEGERYTSIGEIVILDDGRIAFQAELNGEQVTVIDGQIIDNNQNPGGEHDPSDSDASSELDDSSNPIDSDENDEEEDSPGTSTTERINRSKKNWSAPPIEQNHPVCTGIGCNF